MTQVEDKSFISSCKGYFVVCGIFFVLAIVVAFSLPSSQSKSQKFLPVVNAASEMETEVVAEFDALIHEVGFKSNKAVRGDDGLALYRQPSSKGAVEWFYLHVTGNRDVSMAILEEAEKNDIPLSLAFALAYTESRYNVRAVNKNTNASIDRGLFQLNNKSFPQLEEKEFFDPAISAKYGMSHLRFCLNLAGDEVTGLAMYNAGTNKVRSGRTPQITLNYVGKIKTYQEKLEKLFAEEVTSYYETSYPTSGISVAFLGNRKLDR